MFGALIILLFVLIVAAIINGRGGLLRCSNDSNMGCFLDHSTTATLRGILILMVLVSHIEQNVEAITLPHKGLISTWGGLAVSIFFLLSGYGNYISVRKNNSNLWRWILKRVVKLLFTFVLCFLVVVLVLLFLRTDMTISYLLKQFFTLSMPYTTTWYLKIQLLLYILMALSALIGMRLNGKKYMLISLFAFSFCYALIAYVGGLSDFWWKTSLCFAVGALMAQHSSKIEEKLVKHPIVYLLLAFIVALISVVYIILAGGNYELIPQLLAYVLFSVSVSCGASILKMKLELLIRLGAYSLEIFLVHIGLMKVWLSMDMNLYLLLVSFVAVSFALAIVVHQVTKRIPIEKLVGER